MSSGQNPVLELMRKADGLARSFDQIHSSTLPNLQSLVNVLSAPSSTNEDPNEHVERQLSSLRQALDQMENCVGEMMGLLYNVDLFLERPQERVSGGKDPKAALEHVSELFHMYQSELFAKREALSDLTCEEISGQEFAQKWSSMDEVQEGRRQTMDDLADLLAGMG
ncbi:hypothetical protein CBS101457_003502 [Exobasidium rhododendri]|nr:hypothetical protein CBS101457_003502 [Exobasidium rhododendri]